MFLFVSFRICREEQWFAEQEPERGEPEEKPHHNLYQPLCLWPCWHVVVWFGLFSGHVPVRQPYFESLLPQRGGDGPETPGDGENYSLSLCLAPPPSLLSPFAFFLSPLSFLALSLPLSLSAYTQLQKSQFIFLFLYLFIRLPHSLKTAWWNLWTSSGLKNHPTCAVSNLMMPSSQVHVCPMNLLYCCKWWPCCFFSHS